MSWVVSRLLFRQIFLSISFQKDPAEAFSGDMPRNAMRYIEVDHALPSREIAPLLNELSRQPVTDSRLHP